MKKHFASILLSSLLVGNLMAQGNDHEFQVSSNLEIFDDIVRELDIFYVDTLDYKEAIERGISAMLRGIDPYTEYYPEADMKNLKTMTTGKYAGIGSIIRQYKGYDYIYIDEPYEGMPAQKAGLKAGDIILAIDGESMKGRESQYVSDHLRGDPGTSLTVAVRHHGQNDSIEYRIDRSIIAMPAVPYYGMVGEYGYILLESFTENCSRQVLEALVSLKAQGAKGIILDLRSNGGGLLQEAVDIVGLFVPQGTRVVDIKGRNSRTDNSYSTQHKPVDTQIPLVVLIDGESASASEIVAGSLQDLDRAVILGARSYGKGLVQSTRPLPYNGTIKLTTAKYYIPSGRCIQEIDYTHRNDKGQAQHIPDSLTSEFHTAAGRPVRDGGGIRPDIECIPDTIPELVYALSQDIVLFNYASDYHAAHPEIAPADEFAIDDSELESFKQYIAGHDFKFTSSSSQALKSLRSLAKAEGLEGKALAEFQALESKLTYDMENDLDLFTDDLKRILAIEIVGRYYYQKGMVVQGLKGDKFLEEAVKLLSDQNRWRGILKGAPVEGRQ
ncbi:MAG: S41 family peptidase [Bacteroidaceae bacterium]|nr:S41 family peptidase [Bacteroidaceae bacterium]